MISLLIATKDRPRALLACLKSIERSRAKHCEIIVVDQSEKKSSAVAQYVAKHARIRFFSVPGSGKSRELQVGFSKATGEIIAFTDDDCLADPQWLSVLERTFQDNKIAAVFGQTVPHEPQRHQGKICPCTSIFSRRSYISGPQYHVHVGYGNNMAIRRRALEQIGGFRWWLGPGSLGSNGEDADVIVRLLLAGKTLVREPRALVFHTRWLTPQEMRRQALSYAQGEAACYGLFAFQGHDFAKQVLWNGLRSHLAAGSVRLMWAYARGMMVALAARLGWLR